MKTQSVTGICLFILLFGVTFFSCSNRSPSTNPAFHLHPVDATKGVMPSFDFVFTLSPNNRWMIYFSSELRCPGDFALMVLDLESGVRKKLLEKGEATEAEWDTLEFGVADDCWSKDSRYCVMPPKGEDMRYLNAPAFVIDLGSASDPKLINNRSQNEQAQISFGTMNQGPFTCSDCYQQNDDVALINRILGRNIERHKQREERQQILSHDKNKIFFSRKEGEKITLYTRSIVSGEEKILATYSGACLGIKKLRLSPDGRYLAYILYHNAVSSCGLKPNYYLNVIDLVSGRNAFVAPSEELAHWNAQSTRLYFYKCVSVSRCDSSTEQFIYYADISK